MFRLGSIAARLRCRPSFSCVLQQGSQQTQLQKSAGFSSAASLHQNQKAASESESVWGLKKNNPDYWEGYLSTRPSYGDEFYNRIYKYHASHAGSSPASFSVAHDVGAGPGQVSAQLARRYSHVVVSDVCENHLEYARHYLSADAGLPPSQFTYSVSTGEELGAKFPRASADLIVCPLMFPLMDRDAALESFQSLLKPNGTLAVWFYSRAHFSEPEYAQTCQPLLDRIINNHYAREIQGNGPEHSAKWKPVADSIASWLDDIPFVDGQWHSVERWKWNSSWTNMGFFTQDACDFKLEPTSSVGEKDKVIKIEDRGLWRKDWDAGQLRKFVRHLCPFRDLDEKPTEQTWTELTKAMGGAQAKRAFSWPLVLILASRK
ncbi:hypothetical protein MGYG_02583 [Nannizzia gypsea CBS 118893]|uniref:Methyltransferase domain-containing protein n=1 Tax=Arthroderma gypseum (strain ATCC MYA-4604 / CBS 118893) TaxID=535722 RepID=E4UNB0_ARTGP|nr:hypothetical protein MGYG_02583 [Nannizzia gypsea CBS 118893]EFQ99571.1 hypothetical protein MGYG_02583 [Nannizzia gypsea CBS 118893]